ncbi:hypothetical protein V8C44DRAFT_326109 [Trichoderma aethiopicum]
MRVRSGAGLGWVSWEWVMREPLRTLRLEEVKVSHGWMYVGRYKVWQAVSVMRRCECVWMSACGFQGGAEQDYSRQEMGAWITSRAHDDQRRGEERRRGSSPDISRWTGPAASLVVLTSMPEGDGDAFQGIADGLQQQDSAAVRREKPAGAAKKGHCASGAMDELHMRPEGAGKRQGRASEEKIETGCEGRMNMVGGLVVRWPCSLFVCSALLFALASLETEVFT